MDYKHCPICGETKTLQDFAKCKNRKDGLSPKCKVCLNKISKIKRESWTEEQKLKASARKEKWLKKNLQKSKNWYFQHHLRYKYNLSLEEVENLKQIQNNQCAICQNPLDKPFVDHDHETGLVRGLLCRGCNSGIGFLKDSISNLKSAIKYLESNLSNDDLKKCNWDTFPESVQ